MARSARTESSPSSRGVAVLVERGGEPDIVWSYPDPRHDAEAVHGLLCFVEERVDLGMRPDEQRH